MGGNEGPWARKPGADRKDSRIRLIVWLALVAAGGLGLLELSRLFPRHNTTGFESGFDDAYIVRYAVLLVLISSGVVFARRRSFSEIARNVAIWMAIVAVLVLGFTYQTELETIALRVRSELIPSYAVETSPSVLALTASPGGEFLIIGEVNGVPVKFLVDTGASEIVLSPSDAKRLGIDVSNLGFTQTVQTANGLGRGARYTISSLSIGPIKYFNVPVSINLADMDTSLLGMAFLKRMKSFEIRDRHLYLRWR